MNSWLLPLMFTTFLLGLRHGIDWDHLAAILDIVSSQEKNPQDQLQAKRKCLALATCYSLGHALVVIVLGIAAISFKALLPPWIDPLMERLVGLTLITLGLMVFYSLKDSLRPGADLQIKSRFALLAELLTKLSRPPDLSSEPQKNAQAHLHSHSHAPSNLTNVGKKTSFNIGMIHAVGAETATQLLLITSVGSSGQLSGLFMLLFFSLGLVAANTLFALLAIAGLAQSNGAKPILFGTGLVTAAFSLYLGTVFILGQADNLPELGSLFFPPQPQ